MARPWRAGGDGRSVSFPELPWKKEKPVPETDCDRECEVVGGEHDCVCVDSPHKTEIHEQYRDVGLAALHYFACTCGACGTLQDTAEGAREEAHKHLEWVRLNAAAS